MGSNFSSYSPLAPQIRSDQEFQGAYEASYNLTSEAQIFPEGIQVPRMKKI